MESTKYIAHYMQKVLTTKILDFVKLYEARRRGKILISPPLNRMIG